MRTWNRSPKDFSSPLSSTDLAASERVPEESAIDMLRESSTSTATTFCCGRNVATLNAGCQSRKRISATMQVSSTQMAMGRKPLSIPWLRRTCQKSRPAATRIATASSQSGQGVKNTNWPLWKMLVGYLNRSSNMKSTSREHGDRYMDARGATRRYRQSQTAGKFNKRAHLRKALVCQKDSTG